MQANELRKLRREALELVRRLERIAAPKDLIQKARVRFQRRNTMFYRGKYPSYRVLV